MSWHLEPIDWIDRLVHKKSIDRTCRNALCAAMNSGGYFTGGAARALAAVFLGPQYKGILENPCGFSEDRDHLEYFGFTISLSGLRGWDSETFKPKDNSRQWKSGTRDLDLFFTTKEASKKCIDRLREAGEYKWNDVSLARYGEEYIYGRNLLQVITHFSGQPETVLNAFDIANAKVYFDAKGLHWSDDWMELEQSGVLGIDRFDKQNLLWRVTKWMSSHKYENLREGDHKGYNDAVFKAIAEINEGKLIRWGHNVEISTIQGHAKKMVYKMPPAEALKACIIFDSYDKLNIIKDVAQKALNQ